MTKKYTNCPTCGGLCYYPSRNWEIADVKISTLTMTEMEREFNYALEGIKYLEQLLMMEKPNNLLGTLSTDDLWKAFLIKSRGFRLLTYSELFRPDFNRIYGKE
jgi:hypothetical protein